MFTSLFLDTQCVCFALSEHIELCAAKRIWTSHQPFFISKKCSPVFLLLISNFYALLFCNSFMEEKESSNIMCVRETTTWGNQPILDIFFTIKSREQFFPCISNLNPTKKFLFNVFFSVSVLVELVASLKLNFLTFYYMNTKTDTLNPIWKTNMTKNNF